MSVAVSVAVALTLVSGAPCFSGHTQAECDAVAAAARAYTAGTNRSDERRESAAATAYMAAQNKTGAVSPLPPEVRLKLLYQATDLIAGAAGEPVVVKTLIAQKDGPICGAGLIGGRPDTFYMDESGLKRHATTQQLREAGCFRQGGVVLANY